MWQQAGPLGLAEETASLPSCLYIQVPLSVVLKWDTPTRQKLLMEAFVLNKQSSSKRHLCPLQCGVFRYLLQMECVLLEWYQQM